MRRLPIFFLLDISESMIGPGISQIERCMEAIVETLRGDPHALETVHLSVLAFAGKADALTPLTDLASFYPPRLPIGSGTSLGEGLSCLMEQIDKNVRRRSQTQRGDYKPVVYLMTDGRPTDRYDDPLQRWMETYAKRASVIAVALGDKADTGALKSLTDEVFLFDESKAESYGELARWVSASISIQSQGVDSGTVSLAKPDGNALSFLDKALDKTRVDDQTVVIPGKCSKTKNRYLLKYAPADQADGVPAELKGRGLYVMAGCYPVDASYDRWSDETLAAPMINTRQLIGGASCPHCSNRYALAIDNACGGIHCVAGDGEATCPHCGTTANYGSMGVDDPGDLIERGRG